MAWEGTYERLFFLALGSSYHVPSLANNIMNFLEGARLYKKNTTYVATLIYEFIILNDASMTPDVKCFWLPVKLPHFLLLSELYSIIEKYKLAKVYYNRGTYDVHTVSANSPCSIRKHAYRHYYR